MKKILTPFLILIFISTFFTFNIIAQDFDNYHPTVSTGQLPKALLTTSLEKYQISVEQAKASNAKVSSAQKQFLLKNNYVLDELVKNGQLLFNDPMSEYVNSVLDNILKGHQDLRRKLQVYMIRSASVNAFASDRGEIFINIGLLAKLNNEAELAFILCHEIQHFVQKHSMKTYIKFDDLTSVRPSEHYSSTVSKHSYERDLEREADRLGLELFLKSEYSHKAALGVFDLLSLTHVPYSNIKFDNSFLENDYIRFYYIDVDSVKPIEPIIDDADEYSTHPSLSERKSLFEDIIKNEKDTGKEFLQSKAKFDQIQKIARFDLCDILIASRFYAGAFYHSYIILQEYPNNSYAEKNIAKALYGIAQVANRMHYQDGGIENLIYRGIYDEQGEMQRVFHFLNQLTFKELNVLAGRYCWDLSKKYIDDISLHLMAQDMIEDIVIFQIKEPNDFFVAEQMLEQDISFAKYGFGDLLDDDLFKEWIGNGLRYQKKLKERYAELEKSTFTNYMSMTRQERKALRKKYKKEAKAEKRQKMKGIALNIDTAIFINPIFVEVKEEDYESNVQLIASEEKQQGYKQWILDIGDEIGMETIVLDAKHLADETSAIEYNEIATINRWMTELLSNDMYMISSNYEDVKRILDKYNTSKIVLTGGYTMQIDRLAPKFIYIYYFAVTPLTPFFPAAMAATFYKNNQSIYFSLVFDFEKNTVIHTEVNEMSFIKGTKGSLKSNLFWTMYQMKRSK